MHSRFANGRVTHRRMSPRRHALRASYPSLLVDIDELPQLSRSLRWFSSEARALTSLRLSDYGDGVDLESFLEAQWQAIGREGAPARVELLTAPRILGYAFNPISCFFLYDHVDRFSAVIFEVNSTFGERCQYAFAVDDPSAPIHRFSTAKTMRVSPFNHTEGQYDFVLRRREDEISLGIHYRVGDSLVLAASHVAALKPLTDAALLCGFGAVPFSMARTMMGIYWNALLLWLKGMAFVPASRQMPNPASHTRKLPQTRAYKT